MKTIKYLTFFSLTFSICYFKGIAQNTASGEKTFNSICSACHTIGKGKLVGPDLKGVNERRTQKWLLSFIKSSQTMVKNNDPASVKLFNEFNKIPMPDQNLTDAQIKDILAFIKNKSSSSPTQTTAATPAKNVKNETDPKLAQTIKSKKVSNWTEADYKIKSYPSSSDIDVKLLNNNAWDKIQAVSIPLSPQNIAYPNLKTISIDSFSVKSMYRGNQLAFLIEWKDFSKNVEVDVDKFCDQFAIELPLNTETIPSYMMGNAGGKVYIAHWKAIWQEDCEKGFQDVQKKYPNMWVDVYPGQEGYIDRSKKNYAKDMTAEQFVEASTVNYMPGTYSHNPMSQIKRKYPVEEATSEGFGTLATQEKQQGKAWAEWKDGKWKLCMIIPVNTGDNSRATFEDKTKIAFALWDGDFQNIGGRKHFIPWADLLIVK